MNRDSRDCGPPWRPAGERWPPRHGRFGAHHRVRVRFFRRMALAGLALVALVVTGLWATVWLVAARFGLRGAAVGAIAPLVLLAAVFGVAALLVAMRRAASPLAEVMDAADRVADGDYGVRVREAGPPPMRALALSFNTMTERLQHADRLRRDLMADLAHELRTPLTVLQGRLEGMVDGVYPRGDAQIGEVLDETRVLSRLVDDLRVLALSEAGALPLHRELADVIELVRDAVRSLQPEASDKDVTLAVATSIDTVAADVDAVRIREVLTNLLSNAIRHTPPGQAVTVSVAASDRGVTVTVTDTGEGMSPEQIARMFDRFYKGPASRGSGLGLAIAKGIVTAHGGDITASSQPGRGTAVTFTLPRLDAAARS